MPEPTRSESAAWIADGALVEGWRDPHEAKVLPDVTLTGDEFVHMLAIQGETLAGIPTAHARSRVPLGFTSPDCTCCQSIMAKSGAYQEHIHIHVRGPDV